MKSIEVPKSKVVYVVSSTLRGEVRSHRYGLTEKDEVKNAETERELARHSVTSDFVVKVMTPPELSFGSAGGRPLSNQLERYARDSDATMFHGEYF